MTDQIEHRLLTVWKREPNVWEWACSCGVNRTARSEEAALQAWRTHE